MLCLAVFEPCLYGLTFLSVPTTKGLSLAMTIGTEKTQVFETVVVVDAIFVLKLKHDFLIVPHQYTITLCVIRVIACGTLISPIKIAYESFFYFNG